MNSNENKMSLNTILDNARKYAKSVNKCTWRDYESFKQQLHTAGYYGYERLLAEILNI